MVHKLRENEKQIKPEIIPENTFWKDTFTIYSLVVMNSSTEYLEVGFVLFLSILKIVPECTQTCWKQSESNNQQNVD